MKLPVTFATRLIFRLLLPGLILALVLMPLLALMLNAVGLQIDTIIVFPFLVIMSGWLIVLLDMPIYMLLEGRRYWPRWLWDRSVERQKSRVGKIAKMCEEARARDDRILANEYEIELYQYPLSESGVPHAVYPTRLGNILTEYETYSDRKYDMDGVFYWPRIWIILDKDTRSELDEQQSVVDGAVYIAFVLYLAGVLSLLYALAAAAGVVLAYGLSVGVLLLLAPLCWLLGYSCYRLSLAAHAQFGTLVKAMFDRYHSEVNVQPVLEIIADATGEEKVRKLRGPEAYRVAWRYLRWHKFRKPGADENINFEKARK